MHLRFLLSSLLLLGVVGASATVSTAPVPNVPPVPVTWSQDIAPLIYHSCTSCHSPGGPAPFSLLTYSDVQSHALQISQVTSSRFMPPWLPEQTGVPLAHARGLTDAQIALFQRWASENAPEGDLKTAPSPPMQEDQNSWMAGTPDQIVTMRHPYILPPDTTCDYRCFVLPLDNNNDRWLKSIEFHPGNTSVVRSAIIYADTSGTARRLESESGAVGYIAVHAGLGPKPIRLAEWSVGDVPWTLPAGISEKLPVGSDLVLLMRFETDGQPERVQSQVGLDFVSASVPPGEVPDTLTLGSPDLILQPPQKAVVRDGFTLPVAVRILRITPHGNPIARTLRVRSLPADAPVQTLLQINDWNSDWQDSYEPANSLVVSAGTRLGVTWTLDNSTDNPRNPSVPPMTAQPGLSYLGDMATVGFQMIPVNPADTKRLRDALDALRLPPMVQTTAPGRHG
jgi:hypothetical protein